MTDFLRFASLAAMLCASLFFSCTSDNEPDEPSSSSVVVPSSSSEVVSSSSGLVAFSSSSSSLVGTSSGTFVDDRDGKTYKLVKIGTQTWMAENLNYNTNATDSKCYDNIETNCDTYGRLYRWATAKTVCPAGWHLPSREEWDVLTAAIGGSSTEAKYLKTTSGWYNNGNGTDAFGFSAMPGGLGGSYSENDYYFGSIGLYGLWWSATIAEDDDTNVYIRYMDYSYEMAIWSTGAKNVNLFSVRCLQD